MSLPRTCDFLIIGGGVMGYFLALETKARHPQATVVLIEKESRPGWHASGRNSGVLHAGFYYTADSLKARFTLEGNRWLTAFCRERKLPINPCGKLVVARNEADLAGLDELLRRGRKNGVTLQEITAKEAQELDPRVITHERALFSPETSSVDPGRVMETLSAQAREAGVQSFMDTPYRKRLSGNRILTGQGEIEAGFILNAAGLYADKIARDFGFGGHYAILPFKGLYLYADVPEGFLKRHIYPVPNLDNPFLGVHFTITVDGHVKAGPTAIPAFWREHYGGLSGFRPEELARIVGMQSMLFLRNDFNFRRLALQEMKKYRKATMVEQAAELARDLPPAAGWHWGKPGIRAQLIDLGTRRLEMDFRHQGDAHSLHVLNAVSPAFTCAKPFSHYLFDRVGQEC